MYITLNYIMITPIVVILLNISITHPSDIDDI